MCAPPSMWYFSWTFPKFHVMACEKSCFSAFISQNNVINQFFPQKNVVRFVFIAWEQRLTILGMTKDALGIREDSYSFVTSFYFLSWLIFHSFLLAYVFGILCCEMAALLRLCYENIMHILNPVPSSVNESVT